VEIKVSARVEFQTKILLVGLATRREYKQSTSSICYSFLYYLCIRVFLKIDGIMTTQVVFPINNVFRDVLWFHLNRLHHSEQQLQDILNNLRLGRIHVEAIIRIYSPVHSHNDWYFCDLDTGDSIWLSDSFLQFYSVRDTLGQVITIYGETDESDENESDISSMDTSVVISPPSSPIEISSGEEYLNEE
jgi:hypothetical protein